MAKYIYMKAHCFLPLPDAVSFRDAAAMSVAYITAWRQVFAKGNGVPGETAVIQGIGGGVVLATLQMTKLAGARVIVTSSSDDKLAEARELGADETINVQARAASPSACSNSPRGAAPTRVCTNNVGEATWAEGGRAARKGGRVVVIGATTGGWTASRPAAHSSSASSASSDRPPAA